MTFSDLPAWMRETLGASDVGRGHEQCASAEGVFYSRSTLRAPLPAEAMARSVGPRVVPTETTPSARHAGTVLGRAYARACAA